MSARCDWKLSPVEYCQDQATRTADDKAQARKWRLCDVHAMLGGDSALP